MKNKLINGWAFFRYLNKKKLANFLLLFASFHLSRWTKKTIHWGYPSTLSIEPTTSCNLRCPECPSGLRSFTRPTGMLSNTLYQSIIDLSGDYLSYLHLYFQGEPYLHPEFLDMVKYADQKGVFTATSTNAHYLNAENVHKTLESGLRQLIVSMDGITQEVYQNYRVGGKLQKVKDGLTLLIQTRKERGLKFPRIVLQFLVTGKNEHQIPELEAFAATLGVDEVQLKTTQIYGFEKGSALIPKNPKYSRYLPAGNGTWKLKKEIENKCWRMWQGAVITWDGKIVPCCFDKDGSHVMGKIGESTLQEVWKSPQYKGFRQQLLDDRQEIEMCKNCSE